MWEERTYLWTLLQNWKNKNSVWFESLEPKVRGKLNFLNKLDGSAKLGEYSILEFITLKILKKYLTNVNKMLLWTMFAKNTLEINVSYFCLKIWIQVSLKRIIVSFKHFLEISLENQFQLCLQRQIVPKTLTKYNNYFRRKIK